ncbi:MarR family transcriptional regulator [Limosilactobacillus sp. RRLNB_1_1]|uniref:MarR family transcriptional regulator n=1 Tax=Limosilactobacillus albertensis TaxID=2759752 RepID=A0A7W3TT31_9LACO|nr:MarR family transcriptional regulator [Limosilactobacillus albertensis]MBB1070389.1 MarR family transcriptional regulator [Limosilactobacillus albertensis]MCD7117852.1 MarR family transcriptional regulator [Limosilactobacillus albertensis]MCD7128400.1 MarR family transcriptional regulator [Limosilactobacillus albertensis]
MTEISDMELIQKMLKSLSVLRGNKLWGSNQGFPRQQMGEFGFGGREFQQADMNNDNMFGRGGFSPMNGPMAGRQSMNGWSDMMGQRPGFDHSAMMNNRPGFMNRQGLIRENLLTIIADASEGIRAKKIAEKAGINQSSVSESLSKLEDDGYIKRTVDPTDKRATLIFLTDLGEARANEIKDQQQKMFGHLFDNLTASEKEELSRLLDKIIDGEDK